MRIIAVVILMMFVVPSFGQGRSFEETINKNRYLNCHDIELNARSVIEPLYERNQIDSIYLFLEYWKTRCGETEQLFRLNRILDIRTARFNPDAITEAWFDNMVEYRSTMLAYSNYHDMALPDLYTYKMPLDDYILKIASETVVPADTDARLMLEFYSSELPSFEHIKNTSPDESKLSSFHRMRLSETEKTVEGNIGIFTGFVQPTGRMSIFGVRPTIGALMGLKKLRHSIDLTFDIRLGPSANDYFFVYNDTIMKTKKYSDIYCGLEYSYDIVRREKIILSAASGVAYEQISVLPKENDYGDESKYLPTLNVNGGFVLKYFLREDRYIGIHARYNLVNFSNNGGTDISGNYFNLRLLFGSYSSLKSHRKRLLQ